MTTVDMDDFEVVGMDEAPSPAPTPNPGRSYGDFINDPTPVKVFGINGVKYYVRNSVNGDKVRSLMLDHGKCQECYRRSKQLFGLNGPDGPCLLSNIRCEHDGCKKGSLFKVREEVMKVNKEFINPKVFMIEKDTFPPIKEGVDHETNLPYEHITVIPSSFTSPEKANIYRSFMQDIPSFQSRLEKFSEQVAIDSIKILFQNLDRLQRPDHWRSVFKWVMEFQEHVKSMWKGLIPHWPTNKVNRLHLTMFAITTGRVEVDGTVAIHKDFRQSNNLIDFMVYPSVELALREMDNRSDPNNYMVSQLARNMAKHKVESKWTISLVWDGKYKDDMDLAVLWTVQVSPGTAHVKRDESLNITERIYYGHKKYTIRGMDNNDYTTILDFDANASKAEAEPSENISCSPYGSYKIRVNNYSRKTYGADIPFTVIIHQEGNENIIYERTWPHSRISGDFMNIVEHSFTPVTSPELVMSTKAASRATAVNDEWTTHFGNPKSIVPNLSNLTIPVNVWDKKEVIDDLNTSFMSMAVATVEKNTQNSNKRRKVYLSEREEENFPDNISDLLVYMSQGSHTLSIDPRSYSPGYITEIKTNSSVMKGNYSLNHYKDKYQIPNKPNENGNARFDHTWFKSNTLPRSVEVECIVSFGGIWFMVIDGLTLPVNNSDYPLCGGFHPGSLKASYHSKHNYQWTFCNTKILPEVTYDDIEGKNPPMIGTFLVSDEIEVVLDGRKIKVKTH